VQNINNRWLALALIVFCALATVVGLVRSPGEATANLAGENLSLGDRYALISLEGAISSSRSSNPLGGGGSDALSVRDRLLAAAKDDQIKGVLLRIDSPGGTVGTSQEVYDAVKAVRAEKPVVVSMGDITASGGYYVACAADQIFANPGTLTGSIGVIISGYNVAGLLSKVGVEPQVIKSGKFKDILSINRSLTPEERTLLQNLIFDTYDQFVTAVAKGRGKNVSQIRPLADGRIFTGRQAQKLGLVDELGGLKEAKVALRVLAGKRLNLTDTDLPFSEGATSLGDLLRSVLTSSSTQTGNRLEINTSPLTLESSLQPLWLAPGLGKFHD